MKRNQDSISLNKTIRLIVVVGYISIMIFLVYMNYILIQNYQTNKHHMEQSALEEYTISTENGMENIRRILYDVYISNDDFERLSGSLTDLGIFSYSYDLRQTLNNQMMVDEDLHGFYIYHSSQEQPLYQINTMLVKPEHATRINGALKQLRSSDSEIRSSNWFRLSIDETVYMVLAYQKGMVTVYGIHNLGNAGEIISEVVQDEVDICIVDDGIVLANESLAEKCLLLQNVTNAANKVEYGVNGKYVYGQRIEDTNLWVCSIYNRDIWDYLNVTQFILLLITGCFCLMAFWIYSFLRKNLLIPLEVLRNEMERIRNEAADNVPIMELRFTELKEVNETLRDMVDKLERQRLLTYDAYIEKQKAQMQYLQLQMQPHFYLNGLKILNAFVMEQQTEKVQDLIIKLSEHLRYLLQAEAETITLRQELSFTDNYAQLRGQMIGREIKLVFEAEPETLDFQVPMLAVQTFIENSLKYAKTGSVTTPLLLEVHAVFLETEDERYLDLTVRDNGQGYAEHVLKDINGESKTGKRNIGINNLKRRCQILYGDKAEFTFYNQDGAVSEWIIPEKK